MRRPLRHFAAAAAPALLVLATACSSASDTSDQDEGAFQGTLSNLASLEFETEVRGPSVREAERLIDAQLYWLVGPFHDLGGDPRLTWAKKTKLSSAMEGNRGVAKFSVRMSVAWPKATPMPDHYEIVLPRNVDDQGQRAFYEKYKDNCVAPGHDQDYSNAWYDFSPSRAGCQLEGADVVRVQARVKKEVENSVDTYPEYDRIWKDGKFEVVAVFGRDTPGSTDEEDLGAREYRKYVDGLKSTAALTEVRASEATFDDNGRPGLETTVEAGAGAGRKVLAHVFLLSKPSWSGAEFIARYNRGTAEADYVSYAGHAGLGGNIQKLQSNGTIKRDQYQVYVFDGCDTFAYIDQQLFEKKKAANGAGDPNGVRDLDIILNAMPAPWTAGDPSVLQVTRALLDDAHPTKFEALLQMFPNDSAPVVVGDEDNKFKPR